MSKRKLPKGLDRETIAVLRQTRSWGSIPGQRLRELAADRSEPELAYLAKEEMGRRARGGEYLRGGAMVRRDRSGAIVPANGSERSVSRKSKGLFGWLEDLFS